MPSVKSPGSTLWYLPSAFFSYTIRSIICLSHLLLFDWLKSITDFKEAVLLMERTPLERSALKYLLVLGFQAVDFFANFHDLLFDCRGTLA